MSTVINNGYRLPPLTTLTEVMEWVAPLRQSLAQTALDELEGRVIRRALALFDANTARAHGRSVEGDEFGSSSGSNPIRQAIEGIREEVLESRMLGRRCDLDPEVSLALIPDGAALFGLLYSELPSIPKAFEKQLGVEEYGYTDQVDRPESVGEQEWSARNADWSRLLGPTARPSDVSLGVVLVNKDLIYQLSGPSSDADLSVLSSPSAVRARAQRVALDSPAAKQLPAHLQEEYDRTKGLGVWVRHHMDLVEGRVADFNQEVEFLEGVLVPSPTLAQMTKEPSG